MDPISTRRALEIGTRRLVRFAAAALLVACTTPAAQRALARHVVRPGDTLGWIAQGYGVDVERLARANQLRDADQIAVGQRLVIPDGARIAHRVEPDETLEEIARHYRVSVSTIAQLNQLGRPPRIGAGQRLILPREATLPPASAVAVATPPADPPPPAARAAVVPGAPPPRAPESGVERARGLVDRAEADYRGARYERAVAHAGDAEEILARAGDSPAARSVGARAAFVEGSARAALGETDRATASFARVRELDPGFEPPKGWLSPRLEKLYAEASRS